MTPSSPDTGAGTPLTDPIEDFLEMLPGSLGEDKEITLALYRLVDHERADAARSRPTTDPAGLDVDVLYAAIVAELVVLWGEPSDAVSAQVRPIVARNIADRYARLSVADGPGPDATVLVEDQERPLIWVEPRCTCGGAIAAIIHADGCPAAFPVEETGRS